MNESCPACGLSTLRAAVAQDAGHVVTHRECPRCGFTTRREESRVGRDVNLSGIRVLIVEDTQDSREMLRMVFEFCGARVRAAASAEEGKRLLQEERPDVLISDIAMPDNGIELIRAVKAAADATGSISRSSPSRRTEGAAANSLRRGSQTSSRNRLIR
jgi:PleD family two-component response regulator